MNKIESIIRYFCKHCPHQRDLTGDRLKKMVYLADWRSAITEGEKVTGIDWEVDDYGPHSDDIIDQIFRSSQLRVTEKPNLNEIYQHRDRFGVHSKVIVLEEGSKVGDLEQGEQEKLDHVIDKTRNLNRLNFDELVHSTYPVLGSLQHDEFNLVALAAEYNEKKEELNGQE